MISRLLILLLILFLTPTNSLLAEVPGNEQTQGQLVKSGIEQEEKFIDLDWLISEGIKNNPEIIALQNMFEASKETIEPAGALEDPMLSLGIDNFPLIDMSFRSESMTQKSISISQKFFYPGKRKLKKEATAYLSESIEQQYLEKQREIIMDIKTTYYELSYLEEAILTTKKNKDLLSHLIKITQIKYEIGKSTQLDILRTQIELSKLNEELITFEQKRDQLKSKLLNLIYSPYNTELGNAKRLEMPEIPLDFAQLCDESFRNRPLLIETMRQIDSNKKMYAFAQKDTKPDFTLSGSYGQRDDGFADVFSVNVAFNLPIYKKHKQNKRISELEYTISSLEAKLEAQKNDIGFNIKSSLIDLDKEKRTINLLNTTIIPQTNHVLDSALANYELGKADFLSLIDAQLMFYKYELEYYRSIANYYQTLASLEREVGVSLF